MTATRQPHFALCALCLSALLAVTGIACSDGGDPDAMDELAKVRVQLGSEPTAPIELVSLQLISVDTPFRFQTDIDWAGGERSATSLVPTGELLIVAGGFDDTDVQVAEGSTLEVIVPGLNVVDLDLSLIPGDPPFGRGPVAVTLTEDYILNFETLSARPAENVLGGAQTLSGQVQHHPDGGSVDIDPSSPSFGIFPIDSNFTVTPTITASETFDTGSGDQLDVYFDIGFNWPSTNPVDGSGTEVDPTARFGIVEEGTSKGWLFGATLTGSAGAVTGGPFPLDPQVRELILRSGTAPGGFRWAIGRDAAGETIYHLGGLTVTTSNTVIATAAARGQDRDGDGNVDAAYGYEDSDGDGSPDTLRIINTGDDGEIVAIPFPPSPPA